MFDLSQVELHSRILDCAGGPSSFNTECNDRMGQVVSIDPLYNLTRDKISERIYDTWEKVLQETQENMNKYIWDEIGSVIQLGNIRMGAMRKFLCTYEKGKKEKKYIPGELPVLSFPPESFDLAVCSHFLFLYSDQLDYDFHLKSLREMLRVAKEVRIHPLLDHNGKPFTQMDKLLEELKPFNPEIRTVNYEFLKGANQTLFLKNPPPAKKSDDYKPPKLRI